MTKRLSSLNLPNETERFLLEPLTSWTYLQYNPEPESKYNDLLIVKDDRIIKSYRNRLRLYDSDVKKSDSGLLRMHQKSEITFESAVMEIEPLEKNQAVVRTYIRTFLVDLETKEKSMIFDRKMSCLAVNPHISDEIVGVSSRFELKWGSINQPDDFKTLKNTKYAIADVRWSNDHPRQVFLATTQGSSSF